MPLHKKSAQHSKESALEILWDRKGERVLNLFRNEL